MSIEHMALVFEVDGLSGAEKLLLLAYANYTDAHGYCWPGIDRLVAMTGTSKSTVIRTRKGLEGKNLLRHQRRTTQAGDRDTNKYRINLDKLRSMRRDATTYDDNVMGMEFADEPADQATDQHECQSGTTPSQSETTSSQSGGGDGVNLKPRSSQSDTPSIIDPSENHHHDERPTDDDVDKFWEELTHTVRVDRPGRRSVADHVREALDRGWTPVDLAAWAVDQLQARGSSVKRPAGFVVAQLRDIPAAPPAPAAREQSARDLIAACPRCDANGMFTGVNHRGHPFETKCRHEAA